ncbi:unnamed protein product, partial [marine sediment metagenome]
SGAGGVAADFDWSHLGDDGNKPANNADYFAGVAKAMAYESLVEFTKLGTSIISGGYIKTNLLNADFIVSNPQGYSWLTGSKPPINADHTADIVGNLAYYNEVSNALLGSTVISGGYLRTDLIKVRKIYVGGGVDEDIHFEDSGVRFYDVGNRSMRFSKSGYAEFTITLVDSNYIRLNSSADLLIVASSSGFRFRTTGTLTLPSVTSAPTGHTGDIVFDDNDEQLKIFTKGAWRHITTDAGW